MMSVTNIEEIESIGMTKNGTYEIKENESVSKKFKFDVI